MDIVTAMGHVVNNKHQIHLFGVVVLDVLKLRFFIYLRSRTIDNSLFAATYIVIDIGHIINNKHKYMYSGQLYGLYKKRIQNDKVTPI